MKPQEITIAIDIGHGSNTYEVKRSKFVIVDGVVYEEHDFNSKVGIELDKILKRIGFKTLLYQAPFAPEVSLSQRIGYYNKIKVNLVVSIHANAGVKSADGLAAFYWHTSDSSKKLAQLYAEQVGAYGYEKYGQGFMPSVPKTWSDFAICRDTNMNAILSENGFMTNENDFNLIFKSDKYVKDLAEIHAKSICQFYGIEYVEEVVTDVKGIQYTPPLWDGTQLKNGQIGRLTILKPINLWKDSAEGKLEMVRILQPNETYRVYGYRDDHGGQYNLGGGMWVTKIDGYVKYETPSKRVLEQAKEYYK